MPIDINGTTLNGGSNTFSINGTGGTILNTTSNGDVYKSNWRTRGIPSVNSWHKLDRVWRGTSYTYFSRYGKVFQSGGSANNFNIFRFTPSNGWTWYYMGLEVHNYAQNGTGYGRWIFPTTGGASPGYSVGISAINTAQGGYQGGNAPFISSQTNNPPFPDGGYWDTQIQLTVPAYSYVYVIAEVDESAQTVVSSITGKWQVALQ